MIYEGEPHCVRAQKFAMLGMTDSEIADAFSISPDTMAAWKHDHPEFSDALNSGKVVADAEMAHTLYHRGIGGIRVPAVKIFAPPAPTVIKNEDGELEVIRHDPVIVPYHEVLAPDVGAIKSWLYNRQPGRWRDRREQQIMGTIEHRISLMSPEQRRQRLAELQELARLSLEGTLVEVDADGDPEAQ